jgi:hypothetical protein
MTTTTNTTIRQADGSEVDLPTSTDDKLFRALRNAHDAGDTAAATRIAQFIKASRSGAPSLPPGFVSDTPSPPAGFQLDPSPKGNVFDQFDRQANGNVFDQFDQPQGKVDWSQYKPADIKWDDYTPVDGSKATPKAQPAARSTAEEVARQLGLAARYGIEGAGNLAGIVSDPFGQFLPGYERTGQLASEAADKLGLPTPGTPLENNVAAASRALTGAGLTMGLGGAAGATALTQQPALQLASAATGASAADAARQSGAGTAGQIAAGALGALIPGAPQISAAAVRRLFGADPETVAKNIAAFAEAGSTPSVGQATESPAMRGIESTLAKLPGSHGVFTAQATNQADQMGQRLTDLADQLAPNANPTTAGRTIVRGITGEGGFLDRFKQTTSDLYDKVDEYIPADAPVNLAATKSTLARMVNPVPGAQATSDVLSNPKLQQIADAIVTDTRGQPGFGALPYEAMKQLRSKVGDMLTDSSLISDVPRGQLKQLYGALTSDIRQTASANPDAAAAVNRAENYYRSGLDRVDKLESIVNANGGPEGVFQAAMSGTKEGASTLNSVMRSLQPDEANVITSAVIRRMGRANPGAQNDVGDVFSTERFLTNWNSLSPQAKGALFSRGGRDFQNSMDQIASFASNLRDGSAVYRNPSGTSSAGAAAGTAGAFILSMLSGNLGHAAAIGGGVGMANLTGRLMTNPTFVSWLGKQTRVPVGVLPAQVSALASQGKEDPDIQDFVNAVAAGAR